MMVQGGPAHLFPPQFAVPTEAHLAPGVNGTTSLLPQGNGVSTPAPASDTTMHAQPPSTLGKRKAETQDNQRLSKRLSLLNLGMEEIPTPSIFLSGFYLTWGNLTEQSGNKLYVPVETPHQPSATRATPSTSQPSEHMELDDSKHKVYIYNLDDELSSESEDEEGKLVFLPDIEKHLRETRIPKQVLANRDGELAGMQLVLYKDPTSLSVPQEEDSVRRAVLEARQRMREKQKLEQKGAATTTTGASYGEDGEAMDMD
ncbi:hypothetical protein MAC_07400 [Metarhizium acridum CQMa 102]|uniref:Uncharacterized protein n=1 Tax=Metarhizium acridum (strain CQMa 102) TaxID=655827 RepID=E9EC02_METAQ|nr:uncharacterized protein MAC_07400 [Metarhizium acridum CQMa 102]EFY86538.1 hypothetical protein MAC_07400 [Metarhizium acridum CQMa 102]